MVIINKADLLDEARLAEVEATVARHLRPAVKILRASHGAIDIAVLLGLDAVAEDDLDSRWSPLDATGQHDNDDLTSFSLHLGTTPQLGPASCRASVCLHAYVPLLRRRN